MIGGFLGKLLRVDLTRGKIIKESLNEKIVKKFIGGPGIAAKILYDTVPPWVDALDPLNILIFSTGTLAGTVVPCVARHFIITKSPLTRYFGEANAGGFWGAELKFAGYDIIIITGRSKKPVYLWIRDDEVEIKDASCYWGMNTREADRAIRNDLGDDKIRVADIGQAGENLVRIAAIMNDEANRAAARCGVGSVMGSKKLKAIAVRGHKSVPVADEDNLIKHTRELIVELRKDRFTQEFHRRGTVSDFDVAIEVGDAPTRNWSGEYFEETYNLAPGPDGYDKILIGTRACYNCPIACRRVVAVQEGPYAIESGVEGIEYESLAALGSNCGVSDIKALAKANDLCNLYGIDTISAGSTIAFAMECYERGILKKDDTDDVKLNFGNAEALIEAINKIAFREGFGDILAEGSRRASHIIGMESERYAIQVKGLELGMHDPRAFQGMALTYACAPTGGRHMEGETVFIENPSFPYPELDLDGLNRLSTERKPETAFKVQNLWQALSAAGYCLVACATGTTMPYTITMNIKLFNLATGLNMSHNEFVKAGERIFNVRKAFSVRHGAQREEDTLPERLLKAPIRFGPSKGYVAKLDVMLPEYYSIRGWDPKTSKPTKEKLIELGLDDIAKDLWG